MSKIPYHEDEFGGKPSYVDALAHVRGVACERFLKPDAAREAIDLCLRPVPNQRAMQVYITQMRYVQDHFAMSESLMRERYSELFGNSDNYGL